MSRDAGLPAPFFDLATGFADCMARWARRLGATPAAVNAVSAAALRASLDNSEGQVCSDLADIAGPGEDIAALRAALLGSGLVAGQTATPPLPLVLDAAGRLYLYRYFDYERRLAAALLARAAPIAAESELTEMRARLERAFGADGTRHARTPDWQKLGVALALERRLTVISGGPGTGKTSMVAALLACVLEAQPATRIALAAPTGKAANRMLEALSMRATHLPQDLQARMPRQAHTVHRLLGATGVTGRFRHDAEHPVPFDLVVVDEASMLDLALAVRLLEAVPPSARLVLLGDKDQLAAVEAGAVFAEISADPRLTPQCVTRLAALTAMPEASIAAPSPIQASVLRDSVVWLRESHRFAADSGIGRLAALVREGAADSALELLTRGAADLCWLDDNHLELGSAARRAIVEDYAGYVEALKCRPTAADSAFAAFDRFRVLCALREGQRGVDAVNELMADHLRAALELPNGPGAGDDWYPGRPVMILRNDYELQLFNGDVGLCLPDAQGALQVWFAAPAGGLRPVAPLRLPEHDTAFAATVHKAQGSEFSRIMVLLPAAASKVLSRELIYTGVTRATGSVTLCGSAQVFRAACAARTQRRGALAQRMGQLAETLVPYHGG